MFTGGGRLISDADLCIHRRTGRALAVMNMGGLQLYLMFEIVLLFHMAN
jgi:hypothetical protein